MQLEAIYKQLTEYELITFDVFDTLITRCVVHPTDVFRLVERKWNCEKKRNLNFSEIRVKAEEDAYREYGVCASLDQIYTILIRDYAVDSLDSEALKNLELQMELDVTIPRKDMLTLFNRLQEDNKKIILCSDMYLNAEVIKKLLLKSGYPENIEILVSCEQGKAKCDGTFWSDFYAKYQSYKTIHLGDNEWSDYKQVQQYKREAILIENPYSAFQKSELYPFLLEYENNNIANVLILGYLINQACFNSPFNTNLDFQDTLGVWLGATFGCFLDWLTKNNDGSLLLFVTREGYILQPMYEAYCRASGRTIQDNAIFYASRAATTSAAATNKEVLKEIMQIEYKGTIGAFTESRLNYQLPENCEIAVEEIELPKQKEQLLKKLENQYDLIFANAEKQKDAYTKYVNQLRETYPNKPLTIVDIGYSGTSQYYLSKVLDEPVSGKYLYLNRNPLPKKNGCECDSLAYTADGCHPIFENLLYLEAAMQVPYGQLKQMQLNENGIAEPICKCDAQTSAIVKEVQQAFLDYVTWMGTWQNCLGNDMIFDFSLAETIWICMLQFSYLPEEFLDNLWLSDDFAGNPKWTYNKVKKSWDSDEKSIPIVFSITEKQEKTKMKYRMKLFVKRYIPIPFYEFARQVWIRWIK